MGWIHIGLHDREGEKDIERLEGRKIDLWFWLGDFEMEKRKRGSLHRKGGVCMITCN